MDLKNIVMETKDSIAIVKINRPDALNALNPEVLKELEGVFNQLKEQKDPRMFGNGKVFDEYGFHVKSHSGYYERFIGGQKKYMGWVNKSDYEKEPITDQ